MLGCMAREKIIEEGDKKILILYNKQKLCHPDLSVRDLKASASFHAWSDEKCASNKLHL